VLPLSEIEAALAGFPSASWSKVVTGFRQTGQGTLFRQDRQIYLENSMSQYAVFLPDAALTAGLAMEEPAWYDWLEFEDGVDVTVFSIGAVYAGVVVAARQGIHVTTSGWDLGPLFSRDGQHWVIALPDEFSSQVDLLESESLTAAYEFLTGCDCRPPLDLLAEIDDVVPPPKSAVATAERFRGAEVSVEIGGLVARIEQTELTAGEALFVLWDPKPGATQVKSSRLAHVLGDEAGQLIPALVKAAESSTADACWAVRGSRYDVIGAAATLGLPAVFELSRHGLHAVATNWSWRIRVTEPDHRSMQEFRWVPTKRLLDDVPGPRPTKRRLLSTKDGARMTLPSEVPYEHAVALVAVMEAKARGLRLGEELFRLVLSSHRQLRGHLLVRRLKAGTWRIVPAEGFEAGPYVVIELDSCLDAVDALLAEDG
jgi:hypothetical protein